MTNPAGVDIVLRCYPKIYFACHMQHVRDEAVNRTLSPQQASILDHLDSIEPTGVRELAGHMGVTSSTMSTNLDRLENGGYVKRTRDHEDSRRVQVRLTKAGVRIKLKQKVVDPGLVDAMLQQLAPADLARALKGLELLAGAAMKALAERT